MGNICAKLQNFLFFGKSSQTKNPHDVEKGEEPTDETKLSIDHEPEKQNEELKQHLRELSEKLEGCISDQTHLKKEVEELKSQRKENTSRTNQEEIHQSFWIVPEVLYSDDRVTGILQQAVELVGNSWDVRSMSSSAINMSHRGRVLLPCIGASRMGSDLNAAVERAKLGTTVSPIVLFFHHLAPHKSKITTATKKRISDRALVERCEDIIDLVFWNGSMYECETNDKGIDKLRALTNTTKL